MDDGRESSVRVREEVAQSVVETARKESGRGSLSGLAHVTWLHHIQCCWVRKQSAK